MIPVTLGVRFGGTPRITICRGKGRHSRHSSTLELQDPHTDGPDEPQASNRREIEMNLIQLDYCIYGPCTRAPFVKGMCNGHYAQWKSGKSFEPLRPATRTAKRTDLSYGAAHVRVKSIRGSASAYQCVDCGVRAQDWSLNQIDPDYHMRGQGEGAGRNYTMWYSLDPMDYTPRCKSCHKKLDWSVKKNDLVNE